MSYLVFKRNGTASTGCDTSHYVEVTTRASEWKESFELEKTGSLRDVEKERLVDMKNKFNLLLCADYHQCKLVPYWGMSPQPGSTYYLQKFNHDVFEIVNHGLNSSAIYLMNVWVLNILIIPFPTLHTFSAHSLLGSSVHTCFSIMLQTLIKTTPWLGL